MVEGGGAGGVGSSAFLLGGALHAAPSYPPQAPVSFPCNFLTTAGTLVHRILHTHVVTCVRAYICTYARTHEQFFWKMSSLVAVPAESDRPSVGRVPILFLVVECRSDIQAFQFLNEQLYQKFVMLCTYILVCICGCALLQKGA